MRMVQSEPEAWRSSPIAKLPRVAGMATMPSRLGTLPQAVASIVDQVDRFYVFLDGHTSPPECLRHEKIVTIHASELQRRLGSSGKFLGLTREANPCVYLSVDDDILYPRDYVDTLVAALVRFNGAVVVGFHGALFMPPWQSFVQDQDVCPYSAELEHDVRVDAVGAGTAAIVSPLLRFDPRAWPEWDMDDLMLSIEAERRGMPRVALARPRGYLTAITRNQPDSIWVKTKRDDRRHTRRMLELIAMERRSRMGMPPRRDAAMRALRSKLYSTPAPSSAGMALARNMRKSSRPIPY